jgi:hypothetical protein
MLRYQASRKRLLSYGMTGVVLTMLALAPAALASAAPRSTTASVTKATITNCTKYSGSKLSSFIAAAEAKYPATECLYHVGESLSAASTVQITSPVAVNFEGASVSGTAALKSAILDVTTSSAKTKISDVTLKEGKGSGDGIDCHAACIITDSTVEGMKGDGIFVTDAPGSVIGGDSVASKVSTVGNTKSGLEVNHTVGVRVGDFTSTLDNHFGVSFETVSGTALMPCSANSITTTDVGTVSGLWKLPANISGSGLELVNTGTKIGSGCSFKSVTANGQGGYGLALGGSSYNTFAHVSTTGESKGHNNPGINLDSGSAYNTFTSATITHETVGVEIGNSGVKGGSGEVGNDHNAFGTLKFTNDSYGAIGIIGGTHNTFTSVKGTEIGNAGGGFYEGLIQFRTNPVTKGPDTGNVVTSASFTQAPREGKYDLAPYVAYADSATSGNSVTLSAVDAVTYSIAPCDQTKGTNKFAGCAR